MSKQELKKSLKIANDIIRFKNWQIQNLKQKLKQGSKIRQWFKNLINKIKK